MVAQGHQGNMRAVSMIRFGTNPYDSNDDTDDELILGDDPIGCGVTVWSSRLGPQGVNLPTPKVIIEAKKKLLERQEGERHLVTPKIPRAGQWVPTQSMSYVRNAESEEEDTIMMEAPVRKDI